MTDQGSMRKRKLLDVPNIPDPLSLTEFPRYESLPLPSDKSPNSPSDALSLELDSNRPRENLEAKDFQREGWDQPIIIQLEELLSSSIHSILSNAIKAISASGYSEEDAQEAIWKSSLNCFRKDLESNIVDDALTFLRETKKVNSLRDYPFEDLQHLVKYTMFGMICVLMECKPSLTGIEAMWSLLICDLNISRAYSMEEDLLNEIRRKEVSGESSSSSKTLPLLKSDSQSSDAIFSNPNEPNVRKPSTTTDHFKSEAPMSEAYIPEPNKPNILSPLSSNVQSFQYDECTCGCIPDIRSSKNHLLPERQTPEKKSLVSASDSSEKSLGSARDHVQTAFQTSPSEELSGGVKKGHSQKSKRESKLRQKAFRAEKRYLATRPSGAAKNGKLAGYGGVVLDKRQKFRPDSPGLNTKSASSSINSAVGANAPLPNGSNSPNLPVEHLPVHSKHTASAPPAAKIEPSSLPTEKKMLPTPEASILESQKAPNYYAGIPYNQSLGKYCPQNEKDAIILNLVPQLLGLQKELGGWTEWANQKVMQVAHRLSKNQSELKILRQDKEEVEQFEKEKQNLEDNAMKRLYEMECALRNASDQFEKANSTIIKLEEENLVAKKEWALAVIQAGKSDEQCDAALEREQETLKKVQSLEGQKGLFQEALANEKVKVAALQHEVEKAKELQNQIEAKWKQEKNAKGKLLMQAASIREDRQQLEVLVQEEEDEIKLKAEIEMQKYMEDIKKAEDNLSELRLKSESSRVAALRRGMEECSGSFLMDDKSAMDLKGSQPQNVRKRLAVFQKLAAGGLRQDRECVMCLSEEMSVVFLPCAHQVLCAKCNELHERKGMEECPSCRTPIERRINARYDHP